MDSADLDQSQSTFRLDSCKLFKYGQNAEQDIKPWDIIDRAGFQFCSGLQAASKAYTLLAEDCSAEQLYRDSARNFTALWKVGYEKPGISLSETFDILKSYITLNSTPLSVSAVHFDGGKIREHEFEKFIRSASSYSNTQFILNVDCRLTGGQEYVLLKKSGVPGDFVSYTNLS